MQKLKNTIEQKLGDHPNVNSNPDVQPDSGVGHGTNQGNGRYDIPLQRQLILKTISHRFVGHQQGPVGPGPWRWKWTKGWWHYCLRCNVCRPDKRHYRRGTTRYQV